MGTFGASACANTLNQIYEVVNDGRMSRTKMRPLPLGRISRLQALAFAGVMGVGGTAILNYQVSFVATHSVVNDSPATGVRGQLCII